MRILLFTDIDGTLISHDTYSTTLAKKALGLLNKQDIPVIFCSSKTFEEQLYLQNQLGISFPFIVENGSAIIVPKNYFFNQPESFSAISDSHCQIVLAKNGLPEIRFALKKINNLPNRNLFGYADCTEKEISGFTALRGKAVKRAKNRRFTETLFSEPPRPEDLEILDEAGLCVSQGGRFLTVQDKEVDKGKAVTLLTGLFEREWKERPLTMGIGDSPNDASFLNVVDRAFLVQKHDGSWADIAIDGLTRIDAIGPNGFLSLATAISRMALMEHR